LKWVALALVVFAILGTAGAGLYDYGKHSWRFRIDSSDQIEVRGALHVAHAQIMEVMGGDIGRNIFFVPLAQRKQQLEQIPWVESASVMRFVPNRLHIEIHERTPVAFARIGSHISLIDAGGTLMELAPGGKHKYSFAVIAGMNAGEPHSTRAARMKNYNELVRELDSSGAHYSQELSEVDLTDTEDVKVLAADANGEVLVHLGSGNYLQRYKIYVTHVQQWRQQFDKLESVDLRYDGQIIVNPDLDGMARQPALTPAAAKAAMAAGVKTAAIVNYEKYVTHPVPATPVKKEAKPKAKAGPKAAVHHAAVHHAPVNQAALKPKGTAATVAVAKNTAPSHPAASPPPVAVTTGQKKPSAGIRKETPQN
jgi:cell division protein FtsQ